MCAVLLFLQDSEILEHEVEKIYLENGSTPKQIRIKLRKKNFKVGHKVDLPSERSIGRFCASLREEMSPELREHYLKLGHAGRYQCRRTSRTKSSNVDLLKKKVERLYLEGRYLTPREIRNKLEKNAFQTTNNLPMRADSRKLVCFPSKGYDRRNEKTLSEIGKKSKS